MQSFIKISNGKTKQNIDVSNRVFELFQQPKKDKDGLYIVVDGTPYKDLRSGRTRIYIKQVSDYEPVDKSNINEYESIDDINTPSKTDDEIKLDLDETFDILEEMTRSVASSIIKGLVVSGPAGIGKSHTVETTLHNELNVLAIMSGSKSMYECIHGNTSASMLYEKLWNYKEPNNVLVFDDCDGILYDEDALNILKAALDSKHSRKIYWNTNSYVLDKKDIPNSFEYKGGIIFITNVDFTQVRSPRISNHLEAIISRCHYMDLGINSLREKMIHIKNVVEKNELLRHYNFNNNETEEVMKYIIDNSTKLREVSLRSVLKTADLRKAVPERWKKFADKNILKTY